MGTVPGCVWLGLPPPSTIIYQTLGGEPGLRSIFPGGRQECKVVSVTGDQRWNFAFATAAAGASGFIQTTASGSRARPLCGRAWEPRRGRDFARLLRTSRVGAGGVSSQPRQRPIRLLARLEFVPVAFGALGQGPRCHGERER